MPKIPVQKLHLELKWLLKQKVHLVTLGFSPLIMTLDELENFKHTLKTNSEAAGAFELYVP